MTHLFPMKSGMFPASQPAAGQIAPLLNQAVLRLSPDVRTAKLASGLLVVKFLPGCRHLVITAPQWILLREFGDGRTVPAVLCALITAQRCPALRELYELVVKAVQAGILQTDDHPVPSTLAPARWRLRLNGRVARWGAFFLMGLAAVSLGLHPAQVPGHPVWLGLAWLAAGAAVSLGWGLAAGVVRSAGGEVYRPRLVWKTPLPRFCVDLPDAVMGGRDTEIDVALARLAPVFALLAAAAWWRPELVVLLLGAALMQLSPLWKSPLQDLLAALYREPPLATARDVVLTRNRQFALFWRLREQLADRKYLTACTLASLAWLALVFLAGCGLWQANIVEVWQGFRNAGGWHYTGLVALLAAVVLMAGAAGTAGWMLLGNLRSRWRKRGERRLRPSAVLVSPATIAEWLGRTVMFRDLSPADLQMLAAVVKPEEHKRGSYVVREGEPGERLYIVLAGRLQVRRDYAPGRSEPVAEMNAGDVFGEIALLQGGVRTRSIRCLAASTLLALDKTEFDQLVLSRLSRQAVENAVQKVGFLQQVALTRHWSPATMADFAQRAKLQEWVEGTVILREGTNNLWFFLVHRGELVVQQGKRELRRLKPGDSFGELSLLGDGLATASVVVGSKLASCLVINGRDFIDFITQDYTIGLRWEDNRIRPR